MRWFKAASYVMIALALVHSGSFLSAPQPPANESEAKLQDLMTNYKTDLMGSRRSTGDILKGFLISFSVLPLSMAIGGLLAARAGGPQAARPLAAAYCGGLAVLTGVSVIWFFILPTAFLAAATLCYGIAWLKLA